MSRWLTSRGLAICTCAIVLALAACDDDPQSVTDAGRDASATHDTDDADAARDASTQDARVADGNVGHMDAAHDAQLAPLDAALDAGDDAGGAELTLADTSLYSDFASETLASGVEEFTPLYALWSDGSTKRRFLYLPPGTQIDTSDMDSWVFPVGTKVWKEFTRDGIRVETRLLEKTAQGWLMVAFVWNSAQTQAVARFDGEENANGTPHDVPASAACHGCHDGMPDRLLGVSAIQLSHTNAGVNLTTLMSTGRLTVNPAGPFTLPGMQADRDALGALHANCGHCHSPTGAGWATVPDFTLRLSTGSLASVDATATYTSTVGVALASKLVPGATQRIVKGSPSTSGLYLRLSALRGAGGSALAMPALGTELQDTTTETRVSDWITNLP